MHNSHLLLSCLLILGCVFGPAAGSASRLEIHVSPQGKADAEGTTEDPLDSLERARDLLRERRAADRQAATVVIHGGDYVLDRPFVLEREDGGSAEAPVIYTGVPGETVRLLGGRVVSGWAPLEDEGLLARLPESARSEVRAVHLPSLGITDFGEYRNRGFGRSASTEAALELFFNDEAMTVARWPNEGFVRIAGFPAGQRKLHATGHAMGKPEGGFFYAGDRPSGWSNHTNIWLHGYWMWDWSDGYERIASIDLDKRHIVTALPEVKYGFRPQQRYYFLNVIEELDAPGEYFLDRDSGLLLFWPPAPLEDGETMVSVVGGNLIETKDCSFTSIQQLQIAGGRGIAVRIEGGQRVRLSEVDIRNSGSIGVVIEEGADHSVERSVIARTGDTGIVVKGGDRDTLSPARHRILGNEIHHMGRWSRCYRPGVMIQGVGNQVANNLIHSGPHSAINLGGNDHFIELNEIHSVCRETGDVGAIYTGRDWTGRGNVIRHNFIHDLGAADGNEHGSMAIYLDDMASGFTIYGNVVYNGHHGVYMGGGRDNLIENNLFIDMKRSSVHVDARGAHPHPNWRGMIQATIRDRLYKVLEDGPLYAERYPDLLRIREYYEKHNAFIPPEGSAVVRNLSVGGKGNVFRDDLAKKPKILRIEGNIEGIDPLFVDREARDFRLRRDSPVWARGFKPIPFERIGLPK